jgi:chromosomal replication initiation ATPase DnaA
MTKEELDKLADLCCSVFSVNITDFYSRDRRIHVSDARKVYLHIIKNYYGLSENSLIGKLPIKLHRTTMMWNIDAADGLIRFDDGFENRYKLIYELFTGKRYTRPEAMRRRYKSLKNR